MIAIVATAAVTATGLTSCDGSPPAPSGEAAGQKAEVSIAPSNAPSNPGSGAEQGATADPSTEAATPSGEPVEGAPAFVSLYPGAVIETTPLAVSAEGGGVVFTSEASPDAIVDFYRQRTQAAGMVQIMALNNGDTRAYAANKTAGGASLTVVSRPLETGGTTTQLTWVPGQ